MYTYTEKNINCLLEKWITLIVILQSHKCSGFPGRDWNQSCVCSFAVFSINQLWKVINRREMDGLKEK